MIQFFLSSDNDSIPHGTIWPQEVRRALDDMDMMMTFVSPEALESAWTYFEAGYGLHRLKAVHLYCLPGTEKGRLPPPFNLLQSRNLHSPAELTLLIKQLNEKFDGILDVTVSKTDYAEIFQPSGKIRIKAAPKLVDVVSEFQAKALGPPTSIEAFESVCERLNQPLSVNSNVLPGEGGHARRCSTGIRISVREHKLTARKRCIEINDEMRKKGHIGSIALNKLVDDFKMLSELLDVNVTQLVFADFPVPIATLDEYNSKTIQENQQIEAANLEIKNALRECHFTISPVQLDVALSILDAWIGDGNPCKLSEFIITFKSGVTVEKKLENITAKIHGSALGLRKNATLLWREKMVVDFFTEKGCNCVQIWPLKSASINASDCCVEDLVATLFDLEILFHEPVKGRKRS